MSSSQDQGGRQSTFLGRLDRSKPHSFSIPAKKINDGDDLAFFLASTAYRDLIIWLLQLNRSMFPTRDDDGKIAPSDLTLPPPYSVRIQSLQRIMQALAGLIDKAPPNTGPRRFGNVAFRDWFKLAETEAAGLLQQNLGDALQLESEEGNEALGGELIAYLLGSFGSAQRLDYGTGHELSFLAFLGCLWKLGVFEQGEERGIVMGVVQPYLELMRTLILTYTLEPAGSHGVWGLDDHSFAPYIFGSAQFGPAIDPKAVNMPVPTEGSLQAAPSPSTVVKKDIVADYKDSNMYFAAIQFIYDVKKGPFWEHSPVLYDISDIKDGWGKINKGMLKMYAAEVLGKFPVVQHFPFGSFFAWERDEMALRQTSSVHMQQQPAVSKDVAQPPTRAVGTTAPWAQAGRTTGSGMSGMQASTRMATMRAPWAGNATAPLRPMSSTTSNVTTAPWATASRPALPGLGIVSTAVPWSAGQRGTQPPPPTGAPWAKKEEARR
ncbi:serine/threonine-protein phosphatase 2a activator 1 [Acrodontium crateriforme]|uniref:Serine/threonine-protein phosphatase 2A activator n=1 Tax=Acrodontium crateriforme TaxID=150365 RepID=A0AAQ3LZB0_9PEZI|nr:serine/threonine-protein phosphatase 2a activator 1 [Acrodontium crateriforme]